MEKIGVVCAPGIGDALILLVASFQLQKAGYNVTTFSNHLPQFGGWLKDLILEEQPPLHKIETLFSDYDALFLQHDNSEKAKKIRKLPLPIYSFYGSHKVSKHGPLNPRFDAVCDGEKTMVDNVLLALKQLFHLSYPTKENGLKPLEGLIHRKYKNRIAIHPVSAQGEKNWPREKFLETARWLAKEGYEPAFLLPLSEKSSWGGPDLPDLEALTSFIYESGFFLGVDSGPGHIASYLNIPHLIIAREEKQMRLWKPGWYPGTVVLPPRFVPNWKGLRFREKYWKNWITTKNVINSLKYSLLNN